MDCALEISIRPVTQQVSDVHQYRRGGVGFGTRGKNGDGSPSCCVGVILSAVQRKCRGRDYLEPGLTGTLKEECYRAVVGVRAGADVDFGLEIDSAGDRGVV